MFFFSVGGNVQIVFLRKGQFFNENVTKEKVQKYMQAISVRYVDVTDKVKCLSTFEKPKVKTEMTNF